MEAHARSSSAGRWVLVLAAWVALACVSSRRNAGTGDIAFRLLWDGAVDLDLHVTSPLEETIDFVRRTSESGGQLDVDCNAAPDRMCAQPIENVFWPVGQAPPGTYRVWVELANLPGRAEDARRFVEAGVEVRLQVLRGTTVVEERTGRLVARGGVLGPFEVVYGKERRCGGRVLLSAGPDAVVAEPEPHCVPPIESNERARVA